MPEMIIEESLQYKEVEDYDFSLVSGVRLPLTIDKSAGDSVTETDTHYVLYLSEKPGLDPSDGLLPSEHISVVKSAIAVLITRKRKQRLPTAEEQFSLRDTLHQLAKGIQ